MEKQELNETVLCNLRSVTQSCKGGVPLDRLERDYRDLLGTRIPFKDLGFNSLEGFVRSIPDVISLKKGKNGLLMAEAVADSSTAHIASLISRQRQPKIVSRGSRRPYFSQRRGGYTKYSSRGGRSSFGSYNSAPKPSGIAYKQDVKPAAVHYSKSSPPSPKVETINRKVNDTTMHDAVSSKPKGFGRGSYEIAPRFQRLEQRKRDAENQYRATASTSKSSSTPPRTPTPTRYSPTHARYSPPPARYSPPSTRYSPPTRYSPTPARVSPVKNLAPVVSSRTLAGRGTLSSLTSSRHVTSRALPSLTTIPTFQDENGFHNNVQRSPRPLRNRAQSAKEYIKIYAKMNDISVRYSTSPIGQKKQNQGFVSILYLGENKYLSYPGESPTEQGAEEIAAQKAVAKIKEIQVLPETPNSNAEEIQILLNRIEEIVCEKPSGMFRNGIVLEYENKFNEELPRCWLDLLQQSSVLEIDEIEVSYGRVPDGANIIVRQARGLSSGSTTPSETSSKIYPELQDFESEERMPRENIANSLPLVPPLIIPPGNEWGVYVTDTANYIAARLIDHNDEFLSLSRMMSTFYEKNILLVHEVFEKHLYTTIADRVNGQLVMHRVLVKRILDADLVECYFVDEGLTDVIKKTDLQELSEDFLGLPYQAIHFALDGLDEYEPFFKPEHLEDLKYKTFIAIVKRWCSPHEDFLPDDPGIHKKLYSVVLYDTSDAETDICLNDDIKETVSKSLTCKLPKLNVSSRGYLTHVTHTGQIYLRFLHPENSWLEMELERLSPAFEEACLKSVDIPVGKICAAKFEDEKWYRAVVLEHPVCPQDPDMIEVIFIDYGHPSIVKKSEVCDMQPFSGLLSSLGYQAVMCKLYNALPSPSSKWTCAASQKLVELAPFNEELIIRVISEAEGNHLPKVNLHKRIYTTTDSLIISINENLANKSDLFLDLSVLPSSSTAIVPTELNLQQSTSQLLSMGSHSNYVRNVTSPVESSVLNSFKKLDVISPVGIEWPMTPDNVKSPEEEDLSYAPLHPPPAPAQEEMFDVFVTIAATPHNFIVQPLKSADKMKDLMTQMQQFYSAEENLIEMHPSLLKKNCFYAALHSDNEWYRVRLVSFNTSEPILAAVYYVDFGDFNTVRLQNLQKLYEQFRALPCQAIKASLSGVKPKERDWNPVHCVKFKEMVTEKTFVSVVHNTCLKNEEDFSSLELELTLIDTTDPEKDVYIHELLIEGSMALAATV